jgi:hemin uptake protein HemP
MSEDAQKQPDLHGQRNARPKTVSSEDLFQGAKVLLIAHGGEVYRLRLTRNGKLILHK